MKKALKKFGGRIFLDKEITELELDVIEKRFMQGCLVATAGILSACAVFGNNQPKEWRIGELVLSSMMGFGSAYISKNNENKELMYEAHITMNREVHKNETKNRFAKERFIDDVNRDRSVLIEMDKNGLPLPAQFRYAERLNIPMEMFADRADAIEYIQSQRQAPDSIESGGVSKATLHFAGIAEPDKRIIDTIIDPKPKAMLQEYAAKYPKLVRLDSDWLIEVVSKAADLDNGGNYHYYLSGGTGAGKSILGGAIARLITMFSSQPATVAIHDAKQDVRSKRQSSTWICNYKDEYKLDGYSSAEQWVGLLGRLKEIQLSKYDQDGNDIGRLILLQDELNTCYGEGKGRGKDITSETAKNLQDEWLHTVTNMRSYGGHFIGMGQNPLSGKTGFDKASMENICFMALGGTASYILDSKNVRNFIYSMKDEEIEILRNMCDYLIASEVRFVLVKPTVGLPFIALIPTFDIEGIKSGRIDDDIKKYIQGESNETQGQSEPTTQAQNEETQPETEISNDNQQSREPRKQWDDSIKTAPQKVDIQQVFLNIVEWYQLYKQQTNEYPTPEQVKNIWLQESGQELNEQGLHYVIEKIQSHIK